MNDNFDENNFGVNNENTENESTEVTYEPQNITLEESTLESVAQTVTNAEVPKSKKRSAFWRIIAICLAAVLVVGAISFGIYSASKMIGSLFDGRILNNTQLGTMGGTQLTVNKSELDVNASDVTKATYAAYDSSLLIQAYADSSASTLASTGSGVLWTADGYVVTCNHVVEGFSTIKVTFTDGSSYFAESMATDPATDLALLKVTLPEGSETCPITARDTQKSALMLGETVIAIGNPLGYLTNTVTNGILSSLERSISVEGTNMMLMQISAAVNSGNSGGGLYDINGSLIGIVNAKISDIDVEGIGFAIPIDTVINVATQLAEKGYVSGRPQIGIDCEHVTTSNCREVFQRYPDLADYAVVSSGIWGTTIYPGVYVVGTNSIIYPENSQETLKYGDRIYQIADDNGNFTTIENDDTVRSFISSMKVGDTLHITVMRGGRAVNVSVILGEKTSN